MFSGSFLGVTPSFGVPITQQTLALTMTRFGRPATSENMAMAHTAKHALHENSMTLGITNNTRTLTFQG